MQIFWLIVAEQLFPLLPLSPPEVGATAQHLVGEVVANTTRPSGR
jgi:hypothetical protein